MNYKQVFTTNLEFSDNRPTVVLIDEKPKIKYIGKNISRKLISNYRVDSGLINDSGVKCDLLLFVSKQNESPDLYFVELKGQDISHAIKQFNRSIDILFRNIEYKTVNCRLVMTKVRTPDINTIEMLRLRERLKKLNGTFKKQNIQLEEDL
mgnify:CR=1 FL=1